MVYRLGRTIREKQQKNPGNMLSVIHTPSWTLAYSLSTPGSMILACKKMRKPDAPTSQKNVPSGEDHHRRGRPITNKPVYRDFWVTT